MSRRETGDARGRLRELESELDEARAEAERLERASETRDADEHDHRVRSARRRVQRLEGRLARERRYRPRWLPPVTEIWLAGERRSIPDRGFAVAGAVFLLCGLVASLFEMFTGDVPTVLAAMMVPALGVVTGYVARNSWRRARSETRAYDRFQLRFLSVFMALLTLMCAAGILRTALNLLGG